ncbi:hypothetical protein BO94DRAFT_623438 [Aspergillus sclerotioniger CBS 115572]|uniref:Uncharacterized protein n=1 Tax=Aspergillus sclerotioniger CBS 115572 TaxID=1450535 RepID=A0A317WSJ0_9EURO|nr:hypothetical protein BO94DRAFT_623438 [Aspergillus sclerotioniger CBS 115572]PWY89424.1 hypothetical protein BO94DRAFT_623438 [Aspergillus sclerotioniger CBS 115572]
MTSTMHPPFKNPFTTKPTDPNFTSTSQEYLLPRYNSYTTSTTQPSEIAWPGTNIPCVATTLQAGSPSKPSRAGFWAKVFLTFVFVAFLVMLGVGGWILTRNPRASQAPLPQTPNPPPSSTPPDRRRYSLRKRPSTTAVLTSWLDEDCTDDYDPKIERALLRQKRSSKRPKQRPSLIVTMQADKEFLASLPIYQDDIDMPDASDTAPDTTDHKHSPKPEESKPQPCKPCQDAGAVCSLVENPDAFPCEQCVVNFVPCDSIPPETHPPFQINTQHDETNSSKQDNVLKPGDANPAPDPITTTTAKEPSPLPPETIPQPPIPIPIPSTTSPPTTRTIHTSLTHPITFLTNPLSLPCHFCTNFTYGLLGTGPPQTIEVLDLTRGTYIPLSPPNPPPLTRICPTCSLTRLHILRCPTKHTPILPIKNFSPTTFDFAAAYTTLTTTPPRMTNPWCSLCPNPAIFGCGAPQTETIYLEKVVDRKSVEAKGCGLLLCERCEVLMRVLGGRVEEVVKRNERDDGVDGGREGRRGAFGGGVGECLVEEEVCGGVSIGGDFVGIWI